MADQYSFSRLSSKKPWVLRWSVTKMVADNSNSGKPNFQRPYVVAMKANGEWGCSCPAWAFAETTTKFGNKGVRPDCKHIRMIQANEPASYINAAMDEGSRVAQVFGSNSSLATQMSNGSPLYSCQFCQQRFHNMVEVTEHVERNHQSVIRPKPPQPRIPNYRCRHCNRTFDSESDRSQHVAEVHTPKYKCDTCGVEFETRNRLQSHQAIEHNPNFYCTECGELHPKIERRNGMCSSCFSARLQQQLNAKAKELAALQEAVGKPTTGAVLVETKRRVVHIKKEE